MLPDDRDAHLDPALDHEREEPEAELDIETLEGADLDLEAATDRIRKGRATIARFAATLPEKPGVYRMLDGAGEVLYVGKAKALRKRVQSYARGVAHTDRVRRMIAQTEGMEFVVTNTETEALLLEANLIKQLRPRYNVLLRDDKSFPYIVITRDHRAPQLTKHRGARNRKADYYGPFASVWAVNRTLNALQRAFLLRSCTDSVFDNRTRPCLLHQIKRCSGPCTNEISPQGYADLVAQARAFMSGKSSLVKSGMAAEMQRASADLEFERAARYRDRLAALSAVQSSQDINTQTVEEADVFAIAEQAGVFCIEVFFFRNHQNWGNRSFFPKADRSLSLSEVLSAFLVQFYDDKPPPGLVLVSHAVDESDLVAQALSEGAGRRVAIEAPKRGEKHALVASAERNAREALARRLADTAAQGKLLALLAEGFKLPGIPRRVEVYDNSHIMGTNAVGAMIVAGQAGFMKTHYRTFNIQSEELTPGDDFGMMREVLRRRFSRLVKENPREQEADDPEAFPAWPDLVIIDGGRGQLNAAMQTLTDVGATEVPLLSIAKGPDRNAGRETFHMPERESFRLQPRDPVLYFVQRLRDEAHRFAIGTHRAKRKRDITRNPLDEVPGIGPRRKRALLLHFGTVKAIQRASLEDLSGAPGVNAATAKAVYDYFKQGAA